jgi:iron complex transport system permease protein
MIFKTSNHSILIPATMLCGAALTLACSVLTTIPGSSGVLPINAITPVIGVPVIIYILIQRRSLRYFN